MPKLLDQAASVLMAEGGKSLISKVQRFVGAKIFGDIFYDEPLIRSIRGASGPDYSFIDIGAHVGIFTLSLASRFKRCIAIEPVPEYADNLRRKISSAGLRNCQVIQMAMSDQIGIGNLLLSEISSGDNTLAERTDLNSGIRVPTSTLDSIIEDLAVEPPYFIKVDVQGYEVHVFRGAYRTLAKDCKILSEFWPWGIKSAGTRAWDYLSFMSEHGFTATDTQYTPLDRDKLWRYCTIGEKNRFVTTDILFTRL